MGASLESGRHQVDQTKTLFPDAGQERSVRGGSQTNSTVAAWSSGRLTRGEGRPSLANFAVIPAPGVGQLDRRIDCLNLRSILGTDALNTQYAGPLHGYSPDRWRALFCGSAGPSRYTGPAFRFGPGGSNLPASARYRRQPGSSQARPAPPAPGVSTFNARGDGVEQAHVAGWPSRGRPGQGGVVAGGNGFQARGKDPVDLV
jgi:hypothetical protein